MALSFLQETYGGITIEGYLRFSLILFFAILLKRYLSSIISRLFFKLFIKVSGSHYGGKLKEYIQSPLEGLILSLAFYTAIHQLNPVLDRIVLFRRIKPLLEDGKEVSTRIVSIMDFIEHAFLLCLIYFITHLIARIIDFIFLVRLERANKEKDKERIQILPLLKDVLKVFIWSVGFFAALGAVFQVNVATLIAGMGIGGLALAFAAKESLENLLASFMLMIDKPFMIGNWIKVNGIEGNIEKIGFRSTRIRTFDKSIIAIPNRKLMDGSVENFSERGTRRVKMVLNLMYGLSEENLKTTLRVIKKYIAKQYGIDDNVDARLDNLGESTIVVSITYFVKITHDVDFAKTKEEINFGIYRLVYQYAKGFALPVGMNTLQEVGDNNTTKI